MYYVQYYESCRTKAVKRLADHVSGQHFVNFLKDVSSSKKCTFSRNLLLASCTGKFRELLFRAMWLSVQLYRPTLETKKGPKTVPLPILIFPRHSHGLAAFVVPFPALLIRLFCLAAKTLVPTAIRRKVVLSCWQFSYYLRQCRYGTTSLGDFIFARSSKESLAG